MKTFACLNKQCANDRAAAGCLRDVLCVNTLASLAEYNYYFIIRIKKRERGLEGCCDQHTAAAHTRCACVCVPSELVERCMCECAFMASGLWVLERLERYVCVCVNFQ